MTKRQVRVGVIGVGMGSAHITGYQQDGRVELAAICDISQDPPPRGRLLVHSVAPADVK